MALLIIKSLNGSFEKTFGLPFFSLKGLSFFKPSEKSVLISLIFIQFFIPITAFYMLFSFEKTQSTLIILFCVVLLGLQLELSRFIIAVFDLKKTFSQIYLLLGNYSLLGKLLSLFSFLFIAVNSKDSQKLNIEIDLTAIFISAIIVTLCIPLNTSIATKTFGIQYGFSNIVITLFIIISILTILTFIITFRETENKAILKLLVSYIFMAAGIKLMTCTDLLYIITAGSIFLIAGTNLYLRALHKMYHWD